MKISSLFSDGVILQRTKNSIMRGMAKPSELIKVSLFDASNISKTLYEATVTADQNGRFEVNIPSMETGATYEINVSGDENSIIIKDVLFGDVYLLGGQSNMELTIGMIPDENEKTLRTANNANIRMFKIPGEFDFSGKERLLEGIEWQGANANTIADFSAIGYYFAEEKYKKDGIPVGLIHTAVGGAPIEALMSEENILKCAKEIRATGKFTGDCNHGTTKFSNVKNAINYEHDRHRGCIYCYEELLEKTKSKEYIDKLLNDDAIRLTGWREDIQNTDKGILNKWYLTNWEDETNAHNEPLDEITLPRFFNNTKYEGYYGTLWLQKSFYLSEKHTKCSAKLYLGTLVDSDETYINGIKVGSTDYRYPQRRYTLKEGVLKPGKNTVTVRLGIERGIGGFLPDMPYKLSIYADVCSSGCTSNCSTCGGDCNNNDACRNKNKETIDINLEGKWYIREGARKDTVDMDTFFSWHPSGLFNSMIAPLKGFSVNSILFYQGESNGYAPEYYDVLFKAMVEEWRSLVGEVPIYYAEVAVYLGDGPEYKEDSFAAVREVQRKVETEIKDACLIPVTKLAAPYNELHPQNKAEVAHLFFEKADLS